MPGARAERERSDYLQFAAMDLVKELLPVLDDFERALKVETADREYAKGVELIYQRLYETLKKHGARADRNRGRKVRPERARGGAAGSRPNEAEDQAILEELQRGYNFKGKLLRPAMVKVAVRP